MHVTTEKRNVLNSTATTNFASPLPEDYRSNDALSRDGNMIAATLSSKGAVNGITSVEKRLAIKPGLVEQLQVEEEAKNRHSKHSQNQQHPVQIYAPFSPLAGS